MIYNVDWTGIFIGGIMKTSGGLYYQSISFLSVATNAISWSYGVDLSSSNNIYSIASMSLVTTATYSRGVLWLCG